MAEQLGDAVLTVRADTQALDAGLARAKAATEATGKAVEQAFTASGRAIQTAADGTKYFADAQGRLRDISGRFLTLAEQQAAGISNGFQKVKLDGQAAEQAFSGAGAAIRGVTLNLAALAGVVGVGALVQQIGSIGQQSEKSKLQLNALSGAYGEQARAAESAARIQKVLGVSALEARQNFSQLYAALRGTGIGVNELEVLFVGLSKAARLSGASTAEASGALLQLRQGLSAGVLQGDELRSVLENLPVFAQAVAREMGVNVGQLRKLGSEGKITSDIVFNAAKSLAGATTPGKASVENLSKAFTDLKETTAEAFGPGTTEVIRNTSAAIAAFARLVKTNQKPLTELSQTVVTTSKVLIPLAVGIGAVNVALSVWALRAKAAAQAQILLQAVSGPKGLALLALGIGAAAAASKALDSGFQGVTDSLEQAKSEAAAASKEFKTVAENASLKGNSGTITKQLQDRLSIQLKANQAATQYQNLLDQRAAAEARPGLSQVAQVRLENELRLNEKIREIEAARLQLKTELEKPGAGSGQDDPQRKQSVIALQEKIKAGEVELAILRIQNRQAEAEASRAQGDRLRQTLLERDAADQKLVLTARQTDLERQALRTGIEVSRTAQLRLQTHDQLTTSLRAQQAAQEALAAEQARPEGQQNRQVLTDLVTKLDSANASVRQAYADAGQSLVSNARSAAEALRGAQEGLQSTLRGGFDLLTPGLQREQIVRARAAIQPLVDRGVIRTGIDIGTPDQLFRVASFAESFSKGESALNQALAENTSATQALVAKDWQVYVDVQPASAGLPLPRT